MALAIAARYLPRARVHAPLPPAPAPALARALFVHTSPHGRTLLLYVDDMLITHDDFRYIDFVKQRLGDKFLMSDLDLLSYFLGLEVSSTSVQNTFLVLLSMITHCRYSYGAWCSPTTHYFFFSDTGELCINILRRKIGQEPM
jgi:hypothetical protein